MEVRELRIGNLINKEFKNPLHTYWGIYPMVPQDFIDMEIDLRSYKPIPLTEEWLVKFGFYKDSDRKKGNITYYQNDFKEDAWEYDIEVDSSNDEICCWLVKEGKAIKRIKYVHQIQNLFYVFFNIELTIK